MEFETNDLLLRTVTENDIKEIARMEGMKKSRDRFKFCGN